jgi:hypothetical protein
VILVHEAGGVLEIFRIRHGNNHILHSLFVWLAGPAAPPYVYRLLAVASGIGGLFAIARIARRWGETEALMSVVLAATSFPVLMYFSEARGYAPAMFLGLVALALLLDGERPSARRIALFWLVSILGVLAHLTFVFVSGALLTIRRPRYVALHSVPLLFTGVWYLVFARGMEFNAHLEYRIADVAAEVASLLIGIPEHWPELLLIGAWLAIVAAGALLLYREHDPSWLFYPAVLVVMPLAVVLVTNPDFLYARFFAPTFPFFSLLLAYLLGRLGRTVSVRWAVPALVAVLVLAQSGRVWALLTVGRGQYSSALARMSAETGPRRLTIGSDNDYRTHMILRFYVPRLRHPGGVTFVARPDWGTRPPEWLITQTARFEKRPAQAVALPGGARYVLMEEYPYAGLSGWRWFVYRRVRA